MVRKFESSNKGQEGIDNIELLKTYELTMNVLGEFIEKSLLNTNNQKTTFTLPKFLMKQIMKGKYLEMYCFMMFFWVLNIYIYI